MLDVIAAAAGDGTSGSVPAWLLVATAAISAVGVVAGAALRPLSERISRKDDLRSYKRNVYRNFLDHGYWLRSEALSEDKWQKKAELYVADFHRIRLMGSEDVLSAVAPYRDPGSLTEDLEPSVIDAMARDVGQKGLNEP